MVTDTGLAEAKRSLARELRGHRGFIGVGVGDGTIRLYVSAQTAPAARHFSSRYGSNYMGYVVSVEESSGFRTRNVAVRPVEG